jgi:hypothetical protein
MVSQHGQPTYHSAFRGGEGRNNSTAKALGHSPLPGISRNWVALGCLSRVSFPVYPYLCASPLLTVLAFVALLLLAQLLFLILYRVRKQEISK